MFKSLIWHVLADIISAGLIVCEIKKNNGEIEKKEQIIVIAIVEEKYILNIYLLEYCFRFCSRAFTSVCIGCRQKHILICI